MNIARTIPNAVNAYPGVAFEVYLSGCKQNCLGCQSPELHDFSFGEKLKMSELVGEIADHRDWCDIISFLGGEPTDQDPAEFMILAIMVKKMFPDKELWLFTGKEEEELPKWMFQHFDVIKCGPYREELHCGGFPASTNQRIIRKGVDY